MIRRLDGKTLVIGDNTTEKPYLTVSRMETNEQGIARILVVDAEGAEHEIGQHGDEYAIFDLALSSHDL